MMSMKIVQFSRPSASVYLRLKFQTNHPSPNDNQSVKRKHDLRMTIICSSELPITDGFTV